MNNSYNYFQSQKFITMLNTVRKQLQMHAEELFIRRQLLRENLNSTVNFSKALEEVKRILVIPSNADGGILNSSEIVKRLKDRYPHSEVRISVPNDWVSVVEKFPGVDATIGDWNRDCVWSDRYNSQIKAVSDWGADLLVRLGTQMSVKANYGCVISGAKLRLCHISEDLTSPFWNITLEKTLAGLSDFAVGTALLEAIGIENSYLSPNRLGVFKHLFQNDHKSQENITIALDAENLLNYLGREKFNDTVDILQKDSYKIVIVVGLARPSTVNYLISRFGAKASIHSSTDKLAVGAVLARCNVAIFGSGELLHWSNAVGTPTICLQSQMNKSVKTILEDEGIYVISPENLNLSKISNLVEKIITFSD